MMLAFINTEFTKDQLIDRLQSHYDADEFVKGQYWENGRGCGIGCSVHDSDHALYEPMFGIPQRLAYLEDAIFEGLPNDQAKLWPLQFTNAIQPGTDLSRVYWQFSVWMLTDPEHGVKRFAGDPTWGLAAAIDQVAGLCARMAVGEPVADDEWSAARSAARNAVRSAESAARSAARSVRSAESAAESAARSAESAARNAAESAARSAAWSAAWSAAESAWSAARNAAESAAWSASRSAARSAAESADSAWSTAWSAAESAAWSAAESAAYVAMHDKLLELLAAAPVVQP